jgi:undecaprenyl-diphosphatase
VNLRRLEQLDQRWTAHLALTNHQGLLARLAAVFAHSGDSWFWLIGLILVALTQTGAWRSWALQVSLVVVVAAALVLGLKFAVRRRRPEGEWGGVYRRTDPHSFPSGHAVRALLLAVLAAAWGPGWLFPLLAIWAPLVMLSRVAMGVHYLSDILAGAFIGLILGLLAITTIPSPF